MPESDPASVLISGHSVSPASPEPARHLSEAEITRAHLAAIVNSCPDPIIGETLNGVITTWNPAAERLYGYRATEAIGQPIAMLTPPGYEAEVGDLLRRVQQGEEIEGYETVRRARDGRLIDVSLTIFPVLDDLGRAIGLSATTRDITRSKQVAAALAASERRFRMAFDDAPNFEALVAIDGMLLQVNRAGCQLLGYTEAELQNQHVTCILHPDDIEEGVADYEATMQGKQSGYAQQIRLIHKDGSLSWVDFQLSLVRNETGQPEYSICQARDMTEGVIAREKLSAAQLQMQEVLDRVGGAFVELDRAWRITRINMAAADLLGDRRETLTGQRWQDAAPAALQAPLAGALETAMANRRRVRGTDVAYPPRNAWYTLNVYPSDDGIAVFLRDITAERALKQELRTAELRFRALVEQLPATVYVQANDRPNPAMIYISPYYARMTGCPATNELPFADAAGWLELIHPEDRERVQQEVVATASDLGGVELEYRFRCANGEYIWISDVSAPMIDDSGQVIAWLGVMLDVTARIQSEAVTARLAAIVEASEDAIYFRTVDG
ncbi:MAG: PAS domain S-box protein, partial [Thermomicrobiales bacterium]